MSNQVKYINMREFVEKGFLQELNRQFLHPLGLAMEVKIHENENENAVFQTITMAGIWDYRDDPEGIVYQDLSTKEAKIKAENVERERQKHIEVRERILGSVIQPIGHKRHDQ